MNVANVHDDVPLVVRPHKMSAGADEVTVLRVGDGSPPLTCLLDLSSLTGTGNFRDFRSQ